jgi:serine/threonine-protein kinase
MGSYVLLARAADDRTALCPIHMDREATLVVEIPLSLDVPTSEVLIPGGAAPYGPPPSETFTLPHVAIGRFPVTFGQYLDFVNDLDTRDRFEAWQRLPRSERIPGHRWQQLGGCYVLDDPSVEIHPEHPVVGISHDDAEAYCAWRSDQVGGLYRLPTEVEWEKAARGPDGRLFPWGNAFDPSFCLMQETREAGPALEKVGTITGDSSPYGVRDMAGLVREWCGGWFSEGVGQRPVRGGSWSDPAEACGATVRRGAPPKLTADNLGFRVLLEFEEPVED